MRVSSSWWVFFRSRDCQLQKEITEAQRTFNGGTDRVVELQKFSKSTIIVKGMHHLVDARGFGHEEPTLAFIAFLQDFNGFDGHILEAGLVQGIGAIASRAVLKPLQVILEDLKNI